MEKCHLIIDSCSDMPSELVEQEGITLLKFPYIINESIFEDDLFRSITPHEFYEKMRKKQEPSTAQLSMTLLTTVFEEAAKQGIPTVYLSFTSGMSGSFDVACMVRDRVCEQFPDFEFYIVDTKLASIAEGLLVCEAIRLWETGMSAKDLAEWATEARGFVDCRFMIEDLDVLKRGGRIPSSVAVAGAALDVKPLLTIDSDGKLQLTGVARGRKKGIRSLVEYFEKNASKNDTGDFIFIGNADCPKDAQRLEDLLRKEENQELLIYSSSIGPVIGSHVGPGMLAIAFWRADKKENLSMANKIAKSLKRNKSNQ